MQYIRVQNQVFTVADATCKSFGSINKAKKFVRTELPPGSVKVAKKIRVDGARVRILK